MRAVLDAWRSFYGANPAHLLLVGAGFGVVAYVVSFVVGDGARWLLPIWFVGAVLANDLVLYPVYAAADRFLIAGRWAHRRIVRQRPPRVRLINHIRVPAVLSGFLGLVSLPTISRQGEDALRFTSTHTDQGYLGHWLAISGALFLVSALLYAARLLWSLRAGEDHHA